MSIDTLTVPYFDWSSRFADDASAIVDLVRRVAIEDRFILGPAVARLEAAIAERTGAAHVIATANGTAALVLALRALGIGPGQSVVTPAYSFISSASTVAQVGARPIFADVDEATMALDPDAADAACEADTAALLPAYLYSHAPDLPRLTEIASFHGLSVIEDSAVALGTQVAGVPAGRHGDMGVFSFFPAKPAGGIGDGAVLLTDDERLARTAVMLRNHGQQPGERFVHRLIGYNARMDELTAEFVLRRLDNLDEILRRRRRVADLYRERLSDLTPLLTVPTCDLRDRAVYTYPVRCADRDRLRAYLRRNGIETKVYYPRPLPLQPVFAHLGYRAGQFPVAERLCRETFTLPLHPRMADSTAEFVCDAIRRFFGAQ
ncbi:DegT/DnrJ/EryC1/StrS family aminotransferase [Flexivirga meconopsidis]|uniref:DegT/DnrJ/EryC1/StrS family aminotransferase n=1 Tax=Flexivirga meconopsidis TaxID=2977121 RepID=UPI0022402F57|nr:DegT/DnrJ/EryC1/StrS family aminotransferase [Flexivirga meconopsidis]